MGLLSDRQKGASFDDIRVTQAVLAAEAGADLRLVDLDGDGRVQVPLDAGGSLGGAGGFNWSLGGKPLTNGLPAEASPAAGRHAVTLAATGAAGEIGSWTQRLECGEADRREVAFAEAPEGQAAFQQLANDGFLFA